MTTFAKALDTIRTLCSKCKLRPRCALPPDDIDLMTGTNRLHAQIRRAAELPRSAVVVLKDWEIELRKHIRKGHYCRNCLKAWADHMPREEYRGDDD